MEEELINYCDETVLVQLLQALYREIERTEGRELASYVFSLAYPEEESSVCFVSVLVMQTDNLYSSCVEIAIK